MDLRHDIIVFSAAAFLCISGCRLSGPDDPAGPGLAELLAAPEVVTIGGKDLRLSTYMWRDFQPVSPPDGRPLIAIFYIITSDSSDFPDAVRIERGWVIADKQIWATGFTGERPPPSEDLPFQKVEVARDGPRFGPGVEADAVVRLVDSMGSTRLLRASRQMIHRTD